MQDTVQEGQSQAISSSTTLEQLLEALPGPINHQNLEKIQLILLYLSSFDHPHQKKKRCITCWTFFLDPRVPLKEFHTFQLLTATPSWVLPTVLPEELLFVKTGYLHLTKNKLSVLV